MNTEAFSYKDGAPKWYRCAACDAHGGKLWRPAGVKFFTLLCVQCSMGEQRARCRVHIPETDPEYSAAIGNRVPAISDESVTVWYGSDDCPVPARLWWFNLPTVLDDVKDEPTPQRRRAKAARRKAD